MQAIFLNIFYFTKFIQNRTEIDNIFQCAFSIALCMDYKLYKVQTVWTSYLCSVCKYVCALPALLWPCRMRCVLTKNKASQFTAWQQFKERYFFLRFPHFKWSWQIKRVVNTGKSFSEAPILTSTNPQYDKKLFIESPVQYIHENSKIRTCCVHKLFWISKQKQKNNLCTQHVLSLEFSCTDLVIQRTICCHIVG